MYKFNDNKNNKIKNGKFFIISVILLSLSLLSFMYYKMFHRSTMNIPEKKH